MLKEILLLQETGPGLQICTDGWKKQCAGHGVPLINVIALKPNGKALFLEVLECPNTSKTGEWIAEVHIDLCMKYTNKQVGWGPKRLLPCFDRFVPQS
jgi:hypothetical protein